MTGVTPMQPDPVKEQRRSKIVIAVDDAQENLEVVKAVVTSAGYTFMGTRSGKECLALALRVTPRLILLDIQMPEMDGFETCRRLRAVGACRGVPIAFLTASKTAEDVRAGMEAGGNDFIIKPFDVAKLLARIEHWVSKRV